MTLLNLYELWKKAEYVLLLKNTPQFLLRCFVKLHIRALSFLVDNVFLYIIYILLIIYGFFGYRQFGTYDILDVIAIYIVLYIVFNSFLIYAVCKIPSSRDFLDELVGADFVIQYLGVCTASKLFIRAAGPLASLVAGEIATEHSNYIIMKGNINSVMSSYAAIHPDLSLMPEKSSTAMLKEMAAIRANNPTGGIITKWSNQLHTQTVVDTIASNVKSIWGKGK